MEEIKKTSRARCSTYCGLVLNEYYDARGMTRAIAERLEQIPESDAEHAKVKAEWEKAKIAEKKVSGPVSKMGTTINDEEHKMLAAEHSSIALECRQSELHIAEKYAEIERMRSELADGNPTISKSDLEKLESIHAQDVQHYEQLLRPYYEGFVSELRIE